MAAEIIGNLKNTNFVVADKVYDSNQLRSLISESGSTPMIPRKINSKIGYDNMDWNLYRMRHLVENIFARLKQFRAIATRFYKLARNYKSMVALACGFIWLSA